MVAPTAHITQKTFLIGSFPEINFSLVKMTLQISLSLYDLSLQDFSTHAPYTYIHVTHLTFIWKNLQAYNIQDSI